MPTYFNHKNKLKSLILDKTGVNITDPRNAGHFFTKESDRIFSQANYSQYKDRLLYFHYFLVQLEKIKNKNKKDFNNYLDKLSTDGLNINGEKFEILTYSRLIDHSIPFLKPRQNPDFEFRFGDCSIFIECGTRQTDKKGHYIESLEQAITNKQTKGIEQNYANRNTALHLEISKTVYNSYGDENFLDQNILNNVIDKSIETVDYGAIVLINTFYAQEDMIVYGHPTIKYNINHNEELEQLHKMMFNLESKRVTPILRPYI